MASQALLAAAGRVFSHRRPSTLGVSIPADVAAASDTPYLPPSSPPLGGLDLGEFENLQT